MILNEFNLNQLDDRIYFVLWRGQQVASREKGGCIVRLYQMGGFFAEVCCSLKKKHVVLVRGFKKRSFLEPYLELIDLRDLKD